MSLELSMARCKLTIAERWQAIRMSNTGMSSRNIAVQFNVNHTVIGRLIQRYHQTGTVNDRPRSGRPRLTFPREDRLLTRRTKQSPFTSATKLREHWPPGGRVCVRSHQQTAQCTFTSPKTYQTSLFVTTPPVFICLQTRMRASTGRKRNRLSSDQ
jgi:IS30 family transposase